MTHRVQRIPRGVADDERLAVVATSAGELVALDPQTGAERWRAGRGLRACAVTSEFVLAVRADSRQAPTLVVLDSEGGEELWTAVLPGWPDWTREVVGDPDLRLDCTLVEDATVLLRWKLVHRYEGGAAPSQRVLEEQAKEAGGAVRVELRSRSLEQTTLGPPDLATDEPNAGRVGGLRLELAARPAGSVVLRGVVEGTRAVAWEAVLDSSVTPPPKLRP